ncbi:MAG TPA: Na+/H+ antiporter subunit E [Jatrophihabitans sp.]|nr:Na+/H+ antiporter subunit E [Jatrophihabitans sp.]
MAVPHRPLLPLFSWAALCWLALTWSLQPEQLVAGAVISAAVSFGLAGLMDGVARPWAVLRPRRALALCRLLGRTAGHVVLANLRLTRRIWSPVRPLRSGMLVVRTSMRGDGELATVGLLSSLIVDNQLVDLDRATHQLQYHAMAVSPPGPHRSSQVTGDIEPLIRDMLQ